MYVFLGETGFGAVDWRWQVKRRVQALPRLVEEPASARLLQLTPLASVVYNGCASFFWLTSGSG